MSRRRQRINQSSTGQATRIQKIIAALAAHPQGLTLRELGEMVEAAPRQVKGSMTDHIRLFTRGYDQSKAGTLQGRSKVWRLKETP